MRKTTTCARRRNRQAFRAVFSAVGAVAGMVGGHAAFGQVVSSDTQYSYNTPGTAGTFSTNFTPTFTSDPNGELNFGGTATYTATDDLGSASINAIVSTDTALLTIAGTNTLTLTSNTAGQGPVISVASGGATISDALAGTVGFTKSGAGTLTLQTTADTFTGNVIVNAGTLTVSIGQAATAGFVLNNGANLTGNQQLATTNIIYANSGTSSVAMNGGTATLNALFAGNGNLTWNEEGLNTVANAGQGVFTAAGSIFGNFGGTVAWGTSNAGLRIIAATNNADDQINPFANFDLGSTNAGISIRNGTSGYGFVELGGLQSESGTTTFGGSTNSGGHDAVWIVGSANLNETYAGVLTSGTTQNEFEKVGTGTLTLTGISTMSTATNAYSAPATYNADGGTLKLSFATNASNLFPATSTVGVAQGGTFALLGTSGTTSQTLSSLLVGQGGGSIVLNANGGTLSLALGTLNLSGTAHDSVVGGALNISTTGTGTVTVTTTTAVTNSAGNSAAGGIYSPRVTFGTDWAASPSPLTTPTSSRITPGMQPSQGRLIPTQPTTSSRAVVLLL